MAASIYFVTNYLSIMRIPSQTFQSSADSYINLN